MSSMSRVVIVSIKQKGLIKYISTVLIMKSQLDKYKRDRCEKEEDKVHQSIRGYCI